MGIEQGLLGVLTALVGALVYMVKASSKRSDRLIEQRDREVQRSFETLEKAVTAFDRWESAEADVHSKILERLEAMTAVQNEMLLMLKERLPAPGS